jgi:hypothetical protein
MRREWDEKGTDAVKGGKEHQAKVSKRVKLTFALKEYCLYLLCAMDARSYEPNYFVDKLQGKSVINRLGFDFVFIQSQSGSGSQTCAPKNFHLLQFFSPKLCFILLDLCFVQIHKASSNWSEPIQTNFSASYGNVSVKGMCSTFSGS